MAVFSIVYFNKIVEILEASPELKRTCWGITKQVLWAAAGTAAGGVVGGPVGAAAGGCAGVYMGYSTSEDYQSLIQVLKNLSDDEKYIIQKKVQSLVGSYGVEELVAWVQNEVNRQILMATVKNEVPKRPHGS